MVQVLSTKKHTARKEHYCNYCCQKINVGAVYHSDFIVYDGESYTWKSHDYCEKIIDKLDMGKLARDCNEEGITEEFFQSSIYGEFERLKNEELITHSVSDLNFREIYDAVLLFHGLKS